MRTLIISFLSLFIFYSALEAQIIFLNTQAEVDAWDQSITEITGDVRIHAGNDITNIDALSNVTSISGILGIRGNNALTNVDGLSSLTSIDGVLDLYSNEILSDIDGLSGLTAIDGKLDIDDNNALTNIDGLAGLTTIDGELNINDNNALTNIDGLAGLTTIDGELRISLNDTLTNINGLSGLTNIDGLLLIHNNALTNVDGLSGLNAISGTLIIYFNNALTNIDGLSGLTNIDGALRLSSNYTLTNIDGLSGITTIDGSLYIGFNFALTNINGLSGLTAVGGSLEIDRNDALTNIDGLSGLTNIDGSLHLSSNYTLTNIDGLSGLTAIDGSLFIGFNDALTNIDGLSGLTAVDGSLEIDRNDTLSECCAIATLVQSMNIIVNSNALGCQSKEDILESCNFPFIKGKIQYDTSGNCNENSLNVMPAAFNIRHSIAGYKKWSFFTENKYKIFLPIGSYEIEPHLDTILFISSPKSIEVEISEDQDSVFQDFCIKATDIEITDVMISMVPVDAARPGFNTEYNIIIENLGNVASSGSISLDFPSEIVEIISSSEIYTVNGNQITWNYTDFAVFGRIIIMLTTRTNSPMDIPAVNGGDVLKFKAKVIPDMSDAKPLDNSTLVLQTVVNSYDPNDKRCLQGNFLEVENVRSFLDYMIRFENTGTTDAINISVEDTLNSSVFDISSLRFVNASHPVELSLRDNLLEFTFDDIYLSHLDSLNDGYVVFKVKTNDSLLVGDSIKNKASIYFDFNWPIITEEAVTIVVSDEDGDGYYSVDDCNDTDATIYPEAPELCDNLDNNCDGVIDEGLDLITYFIDIDQDGYGDNDTAQEDCSQPDGMITIGGDCDDTDPAINPDAEDIPGNDIDENCDGMDATSSTVDLEKLGISIYPNPIDDILFVEQSSNETLNISLYDTAGKRVLEHTVSSTNTLLDLSHNTSGIYFLRISKADQLVNLKIVIR